MHRKKGYHKSGQRKDRKDLDRSRKSRTGKDRQAKPAQSRKDKDSLVQDNEERKGQYEVRNWTDQDRLDMTTEQGRIRKGRT